MPPPPQRWQQPYPESRETNRVGGGVVRAHPGVVTAVNEAVRVVSLRIIKLAPFGRVRTSLCQAPPKKIGRPSAVVRLKLELVILSMASQLQQFDREDSGFAGDAQGSFVLPEPENSLKQLAFIPTLLGKFPSARIGLRYGG